MTEEMILANATLVLPNETLTGSVRIAGETIVEVASGAAIPAGAIDCDGDFVCPDWSNCIPTIWNVTFSRAQG